MGRCTVTSSHSWGRTVPPDDDEPDLAWALREVAATDPLLDADGRLRLSFTRIDTFSTCPRKFRYQYVDALATRPAPQLSFGSSIHAVLEWLYDRKHPELPSLDETLQALYDRWDATGYAEVPREEQRAAYDHAREVVAGFHRRVEAEGFRLPAAVEAWFELPFPDDVVVIGAIDRVDVDMDGELHVVDYKTNRRAKSQRQVASSLQLAIYALATRELYGRAPATVALDFVVPGVTVKVPLTDLDLDGVARRVADTARRIRAREDTATPNRLCDWCDFQAICPEWAPRDGAEESIGRSLLEAEELRRRIARDVRRLRSIEAALPGIRSELDAVSD
jgi:putative RecB family exonuclease